MNKETNMICEDCGSKIQIIYFKDVDLKVYSLITYEEIKRIRRIKYND